MKRFWFMLALGALITACPPAPSPLPPPQPDVVVVPETGPLVSDGGPDVSDSGPIVHDAEPETLACRDLCCAMCTRLVFLGCPEGSYVSPKGNTCADVCRAEVGYHGLVLRREAIVGCETVACVKKSGIACRR